MSYKTVTVDVEVCLGDWNDKELIQEMQYRGYSVTTDITEDFLKEDYDFLIEMIDSLPYSWYTNRIREKLFTARQG